MPESTVAADHSTYDLQRSYAYDSGIVQQPVAGAVDGQQASAFIRLYSPIEQMIIVWTATSEGMAPVIPDGRYLISNPEVIFLRQEQAAVAPIPRPSGQGHYWAASCIYYFGLKKPRPLGSPMRTGSVPGDTTIGPQDGEYNTYSASFLDGRT